MQIDFVTAVLPLGKVAFYRMYFICFFWHRMRKHRAIKGVMNKQGANKAD